VSVRAVVIVNVIALARSRVRRQKSASRRNRQAHWGCAFTLRSQLAIALQESADHYDRIASGRILYAYSPYGETTALGADEGNAIQYTARENDGTGLYYYRARYYDPVLKRFISEDPIGMMGGANFYAYARLNPLTFTDSFGLATDEFFLDKFLKGLGEFFGELFTKEAGLPEITGVKLGGEICQKTQGRGVVNIDQACRTECLLNLPSSQGIASGGWLEDCVKACVGIVKQCQPKTSLLCDPT